MITQLASGMQDVVILSVIIKYSLAHVTIFFHTSKPYPWWTQTVMTVRSGKNWAEVGVEQFSPHHTKVFKFFKRVVMFWGDFNLVELDLVEFCFSNRIHRI